MSHQEIEMEAITSPEFNNSVVDSKVVKTYVYEYTRANGKKRVIKRTYQPKPKVDKSKDNKASLEDAPKKRTKKCSAVLKYVEEHRDEILKIPVRKRAAEVSDKVYEESGTVVSDETVRKFLNEVGLYEFRNKQK